MKPYKYKIDRMPHKVSYEHVLKMIIEFFEGDKDKAFYWYAKKNPALNNLSPFEMVKNGKGKNLITFMKKQRNNDELYYRTFKDEKGQ